MVDPDDFLEQLCKICNVEPPKYQCPRCSCRTCSLPCYKRHQKLSQCSGKQDPSTYVSKSKLGTVWDRDTNFLGNVQKTFEDAERDAEHRGIGLGRPSDDQYLRRALQASGVHVLHAPKGMSRQKANTTRLSKSRNIMWTVEWTLQDGTTVLDRVNENDTIFTAYELKFKAKADRQRLWDAEKLKTNRHLRKRKAEDDGRRTADASVSETPPADVQSQAQAAVLSPQETDGADFTSLDALQNKTLPPRSDQPPSSTAQPVVEDPAPTSATSVPTTPNPHFYLVKPMTGSKRVLVPFKHDQSLASNLRGQAVFEFPTIQILMHGPRELPEPYTLDKDYERSQQRLIREVDDPSEPPEPKMAAQSPPLAIESSAGPTSYPNTPDPAASKVMEALQTDISHVRQKTL